MTDTNGSERSRPVPPSPPAAQPPRKPPHRRRRLAIAAALVAACGIGAGAGALAQKGHQATVVMLEPGPVSAMSDGNPVAIKGQVAEIFGNKFILSDASGRALVETGRAGETKPAAAKDETIVVQGRFEHGFVHAIAIQHGDGRTVVLGPPGPPPPPPPHGPLS